MEKVLTKAMDLCIEAGVNITDTVIDRAMRIGVVYVNNKSKNRCNSIIVRFTTFRYRTMVYWAKKNMKDNVQVKLGVTKNTAT